MFDLRRAYRRLVPAAFCFSCIALSLLSGCAGVQSSVGGATKSENPDRPSWMPADPPSGFLIPANAFGKSGSNAGVAAALARDSQSPGGTSAPAMPVSVKTDPAGAHPSAWTPMVHLYASPTNQSYLATGGLDAKNNLRVWESFLRKYKIPFQLVTTAERLEATQSGVLLLPTTVALSQREKQAVIAFRARGGSVLTSWLTGVRSENGTWLGFDFMERALDVKVLGTNATDKDDNFMMPYCDNPVTHHLPAGQRTWLERVKEWPVLRLVGKNSSAEVMDWLRTFTPDKPRSALVFDERAQPTGTVSRNVVMGWPERLWLSADPKLLEAMSYNALRWLLHQPSAYVSAWPHPYHSAFMLTIFVVDVIADSDLKLAKSLEDLGGRATYYAMSKNTAKAAAMLKTLQSRGHELGYLGDDLVGFKGQSEAIQGNRLDAMRRIMKESGLDLTADAGFHPPMESYDKTTEKLLKERAFGHYIAYMDASDARLPFIAPAEAGTASSGKALVVLPRTQSGPEDAMEEGDPEDGLKAFLNELELAEKMEGLSIVRMPNQSLLTEDQMGEIFKHLKARRSHMWMPNAKQVADWWRERDRVSIRLDAAADKTELTVTVKGDVPLQQAVSVWVNLPESGSSLRLIPSGRAENLPKLAVVDDWRAAVVLTGLTPGTHRWQLQFNKASISAGR